MMGSRFLFVLLSLAIVAEGMMLWLLPAGRQWWIYVGIIVSLLLLFLLLRSVILPFSKVMRGLELISAQDFNNRLTNVGEYNSDKVVRLFNSLIDSLRNERLKNFEQEGFLKSLINASPMGVVMLDGNGRISMMNNAMSRLTGVFPLTGYEGKRLEDMDNEIIRKMSLIPLEGNVILRFGDERMFRCTHLSFVQMGYPRHFYLLESLAEEVMKAEREAYEKVIRIISHEVNNTMGGVRSVLGLLCENAGPEEQEVIESCDDRCGRMCDFISSYADVVRIPAPVLVETDVNAMLRSMIPFLRQMLIKDVSLEVVTDSESLKVRIDIPLIQQVVMNVVKNAMESIDGKGTVVIGTRMEGKIGRAHV